MMTQLLNLYAQYGESLSDFGISEAVLPISETFNVLELFAENNLIVLGGDLYLKNADQTFESNYIDWFYEGSSSTESIKIAREFLSKYIHTQLYVSFIL